MLATAEARWVCHVRPRLLELRAHARTRLSPVEPRLRKGAVSACYRAVAAGVQTRWGPPPVWTENAGEACGDSDWEVDQAGAMNEGARDERRAITMSERAIGATESYLCAVGVFRREPFRASRFAGDRTEDRIAGVVICRWCPAV